MSNQDTIEKDVDTTKVVERASFTGSDDKSKSTDVKVDIGEAEHVAAGLAKFGSTSDDLTRLAQLQFLRHTEEMFDRRTRREDELSVIRQRQLSNSADFDQTQREMTSSHAKGRNSQDMRAADIAIDRQWNVDEQGYQVKMITEALERLVKTARSA